MRTARGVFMHGATRLIFASAALLILMPAAETAHAGHAMNEGSGCYNCHDLNSQYSEPNTSYIGSSKRNLASIKTAWALPGNNTNGKLVPDEFGCLYCHNSAVPKADEYTGVVSYRMRDASNHFRGKASAHPVGYDLTTGTPTDTSGQLLSTFDCYNGVAKRDPKCQDNGSTADGLGDRVKELDCVDCHDVTQSTGYAGYPQHGTPLAANPFMLRAGVGGSNLAASEYDDVCRRCHGSATGSGATGIALFKSTGLNLRLAVHPDASDTTANVMKESDGTLLKVADPDNNGVANAGLKNQCTSCHATHYSATNKKLFATGLDVSDGSKCTDCHFPGDNNNLAQGGNFGKYGHGKAPINFGCSSCHSVNTDHDPAFPVNGPKMFAFLPDTTPSKYGKDLTSICKTCHSATQYRAHGTGANSVGCLDCHDEHAEGSGSTSNRFMIPQRLPNNYASTELSFFQSDGSVGSVAPGVYDYYVGNANARKQADMPGANSAGVCDNSVCHAGLNVTGTPLSPLSTFMTSSKHTGSDRAAESNCNTCHTHSDPSGSWMANASCTTCHGQPPVSTATSASGYLFYASNADESKTPHARHVVDYGYDCKQCHYKWTSSDTHDNGGTYESIWFDPARNPDAVAYPTATGYTVGSSTCNNLYCHSDGQRHVGAGTSSVGSAQWMATATTPDWSTQNLGCNVCHGTGTTANTLTYGAPDHANGTGGNTANSHDKHAVYTCAVCHFDTIKDTDETDGWTLATPLSSNPHVDGSKSLKADGTTATFTPAGGGVCNNISCHGGNSATWGATLSCDQCHFRANANGGDRNNYALGDGTASLIESEEWTATGHGRASAYASGNVAADFKSTLASDPKGCLYCHDAAVLHKTGTNPFRLRNNNALAQGLTAANAYGWNDTCLVCHSTLPAATGFDPDGAGGNYSPENGVKNVNENHYGSKHADASKGGTFCWDCHDPHGDTLQYMFHGPNGGSPGDGVTQTSAGSGSAYYGIPTVSRTVTGFDVTTGGWTSDDYVNASYTGICQTCHTAAGGAQYFNQTTNTALTSHNGANTTRCTSCHEHQKDFAASCAACHGNGSTQIWPDGSGSALTTYPDRAGKHALHVQRIGERLGYAGYPAYDATQQQAICAFCHGATFGEGGHFPADYATNQIGSQPANIPTVTAGTYFKQMWGAYADDAKLVAGSYVAATYTGNNWNTGTAACNNVDCHNEKSTANPYEWYGTGGTGCVLCHSDVTANVAGTGATHVSHTGASAAYGIGIVCDSCHTSGLVWASPGTAPTTAQGHINGTFTVSGGSVSFSYTGWTYPTVKGTCSANVCHNDGTGAAVAPVRAYSWGTALADDCASCHQSGVTMISNAHNEHTAYTGGACTDCHTGAAVTTHINGSTNFDAAKATYSKSASFANDATAAGTCTTANCHNRGVTVSGATASAAWDIPAGTGTPGTNDLMCDACHYYSLTPSKATNVGWSAISVSHGQHFDKGKVCADCHGTLPTTTAHINGTTTLTSGAIATYTANAVGEATLSMAAYGSYDTTLHTCSGATGNGLGCHATGTPDWELADNTPVNTSPLGCTNCHTNTTTTQVNPTTGVHGASRIAANAHDDSWKVTRNEVTPSGVCATCHNMALTSEHATGVLTEASADLTLGNTALGFTAGATPTCSPNTGLAGCHDEGGNIWKRLWSTTAGLNTGAECLNCHGGVGAGYTGAAWVTGVSERHLDAQITPNHNTCDYCHEYNDGSTSPYNLGTMHRDGSIQLNAGNAASLGYVEHGTAPNKRIGCSNCHSATDYSSYANGEHEFDMLTDGTRWARANLTGGTYDCNACHIANGAIHGTSPESQARHDLHTGSIYGIVCADCHANPGASGHNDGSVQFGGTKITAPANYAQGFFLGTCTNSCHTYTGNWATGTMVCADCHASGRIGGATLGAHTAHGIGAFTDATLCGNCHGASGYTKALGTTHGNSLTTFAATVTYTGARNILTGTCTTTVCHNNGGGGSSTAWNTSALACDDCHYWVAGDPTSAGNGAGGWSLDGSHNAHFDAAAVTACTECHDDNTGDVTQPLTHINTGVYTTAAGLVDRANAVGNEASLTAGGMGSKARVGVINTQTCDSALCHNPSSDAHVSNAWNTANAGCAMCHVDPAVANSTPGTGSHTQHRQGSVATSFGKTIVCADCHVANTGNDIHMNKAHDVQVTRNGVTTVVTTQLSAGPGTIAVPAGCGINDCHNNGLSRSATAGLPNGYTWGTNTAPDKCTVCHQGTTIATGKHTEHLGSNSLPVTPNLTYLSADECVACHSGSTDGLGKAGGAQHLNQSANVAFSATYNYEAGTAGRAGAGVTTTCTNVRCHNGVTTPSWDAASTISCGQCHGNGSGTANSEPAPTMTASVSGSHAKHIDAAVADFTDCANCHASATTYTATGGAATHQNMSVNLSGTQMGVYTDADGKGGVNYAAADYTDDGTCSTTVCHGSGTPVWGGTLANGCYDCHDTNGATVGENAGALGDGNSTPNEVDQAQFIGTGHGRTTAYTSESGGGANNAGANLSCASTDANSPVGGCHQTSAAHIPNSATDPWRLVGGGTDWATTTSATDGLNGLCLACHPTATKNTATHHSSVTGGGTNNLTHTQKCIDCHDPHGDTNIFMMHGKVAQDGNDDGTSSDAYGMPEGTVATTFTAWNPTANTSDLDTVGNTDGLCEVCHIGTTKTAHNGGTGNPGHGTSDYRGSNCITCHTHKEGFKGSGCENCHNAASPYDPDGAGSKPAAPGIDLTIWAAKGHGKATGPTIACTDCHDVGLPAGTHLDGTVNSVWENGAVSTRNTNTAHLKAAFFTPVTSKGSGLWDVQVTFDNNCYNQCHVGKAVKDMRHEMDTTALASNHWSVQFGSHLTYVDGDRSGTLGDDALNAPFPIDCDLNTDANCADPDYAPCVSCHDPHGTSIVEPGSPDTNFMMRRKWITFDADPYLCRGCHP